jgi:hypothetical protein
MHEGFLGSRWLSVNTCYIFAFSVTAAVGPALHGWRFGLRRCPWVAPRCVLAGYRVHMGREDPSPMDWDQR